MTISAAPARTSGWDRRQALRLLVSAVVLVVVLMGYIRFLAWNETRSGARLADPVLALIAPADLSTPVFALIYGSMLLAIVAVARDPARLILLVRAYALLMLVRIAAMYLVPLSPPDGMISLVDPLAGLGPGSQLRQDLFFSGHTATLFLLTLTAARRSLRWIFAAATAGVAVMVLVQHCHYAIDVFAAPFFAFACSAAARRVMNYEC